MVAESDVVDTIELKPDAGLVKALGTHHTFESAIADLVDNAVDAKATRVSVRLLTKDDRLVQVEIVDDGQGMDADRADDAMTLGHQRAYGAHDLGHFGVGMKAASFSHSDVLTVWSSREDATPVGRRIRRKDYSHDFSCERLLPAAAAAMQDVRQAQTGRRHGTTVVWSELRSTYRGASLDEARTWMTQTELKLRAHLGVTFHRLISKQLVEIEILVDEADHAADAIATPVHAVDPFGYAHTGRPGYPKTIVAVADGQDVALSCHIWPAKTDIPGFRIQGRSGVEFQGFYIYRNDRLLQAGGWSEVANRSAQRQLARVMIDDAAAIGTLLTMNPEKAGLRFEPRFREALAQAAAADETTFDQFLADAEDTHKTANKKVRRRKPVIKPDRGVAPSRAAPDQERARVHELRQPRHPLEAVAVWAVLRHRPAREQLVPQQAVPSPLRPGRREPERCAGPEGADVPPYPRHLRGHQLRSEGQGRRRPVASHPRRGRRGGGEDAR